MAEAPPARLMFLPPNRTFFSSLSGTFLVTWVTLALVGEAGARGSSFSTSLFSPAHFFHFFFFMKGIPMSQAVGFSYCNGFGKRHHQSTLFILGVLDFFSLARSTKGCFLAVLILVSIFLF